MEQPVAAAPAAGKLLIVVAHPDDEYAFAASTYRLTRELGWTADQVVVTNGESGYRYSALAETLYGVNFQNEADRALKLPAIRQDEVKRAGRILGVREFYFLGQRDLGFDNDSTTATTGNWDQSYVLQFLRALLLREGYTAVFTLLPSQHTHAHHKLVTELVLKAAATLPESQRPLILGAEPREKDRTAWPTAPAFSFDRTARFGFRDSLNYQIPVNWVIAEHKSQGLFQMDSGRHRWEDFWLLYAPAAREPQRELLRSQLAAPAHERSELK